MNKILIIGQTPPPFGGQAIMIEKILNFNYPDIKFYHVRMNFSREMSDIGKFQWKKILEVLNMVVQIIYMKFSKRISVMYYPPAGPDRLPIIRDIIILGCTRFLFKKIIFHFHAGGISYKYNELGNIEKKLFRWAYFKPDLSIILSKLNPPDSELLQSHHTCCVQYGIEDVTGVTIGPESMSKNTCNILFASIIKESKGTEVLIRAVELLRDKGQNSFKVYFMGKFESDDYEAIIRKMVTDAHLDSFIEFIGVRVDNDKFRFFRDCDIFCFPTFFESETFGVVLLEAMQFAKPVVASNWRGVPDIVSDSENGFLVPAKDPELLSKRLKMLIDDSELRARMGEKSRNIFLQKFTIEKYRDNFYYAISNI